jgi:hypothetical protein
LIVQIISPFWIILPASVFLFLVVRFERQRGQLIWAERTARFYSNGIDRLEGKPSGAADGARFAADTHLYAADLDLFGPGSLFARLTSARTSIGEETLASWLKAPADPAEVAVRQTAVADLAQRLDLREALAATGADVPGGINYATLSSWGAAKPETVATWKRWVVEILGWVNVLAWIGWLVVGTTGLPVIIFGVAMAAIAVPLIAWARDVLAPVERAERELSILEKILVRLERETFTAPRLLEIQAILNPDSRQASKRIGELRDLVGWLNSRRNPLFLPVAILRAWDVRYAFKLESWRKSSGPSVGPWLRAVGEVEALASLACYAFENPADVFPTVRSGAAEFSASGLGHPLLPTAVCIRNDVQLGGNGPRLLMVSGSNMSGKSTLLRAVGTNAVLALAGGVVRASQLTLTPLAIGATMRVQDSLQAGRSRFFAEVTKIRELLDVARRNSPPLLFLLDELFAGTNSADRVAGAEGVIRAFLDAGSIGFVTTHDLALAGVSESLKGLAAGVHFSDGFADGRLQFDYTMRPGVVQHGNGLALMRAVGLEV